jgi:hypothetical protein
MYRLRHSKLPLHNAKGFKQEGKSTDLTGPSFTI